MTKKADQTPSIVGIGASAGGIQALQKFFAALPNDLGHAYAVVVHLSPEHKSELAPILARHTKMPVLEVGDHQVLKLEKNQVYVISPDRKLEITDTSIGAAPFDQPRGQRTAVDVFLRSLAAAHGDGFAVILSGGGSDGALGARAVKESGGLVLVQDPLDAEHGSMPESVIAAGVADIVAPAAELAARLCELSENKNRIIKIVGPAIEKEKLGTDTAVNLQRILDVLRARTGHDFSRYKRNTVLRRLGRRMQLNHTTTFEDYLQYLRQNVEEVRALLDDLLITVTTFFRDPEAWDVLREKVIGPIVRQSAEDQPIRAWVPACATGEEAYSLAIMFREEIDRCEVQRELLIFGSDVDEGALAAARDGRYPAGIRADVSEARLDRFFRKRGDHYRVSSRLRDCIVFAQHNVLRDPPFSGMHLISCRNLLIYLERSLQDQVQELFRYACNDGGYLFLGISEAATDPLFKAIDKRNRIFVARPRAPGARQPLPEFVSTRPLRRPAEATAPRRPTGPDAPAVHLALLEKFSPPSILVDSRWNVVHFSESSGRYMEPRGGEPRTNVADLLRPELRDEARIVMERAFNVGEPRVSRFVPVRFNGTSRRVAMLAQPRPPVDDDEPCTLLVFLEAGEAREEQGEEQGESVSEENQELATLLREKLRRAEQRMDSMSAEHDVTDQDLRAANEELQSLNEEYRSTAEELETSKEELQSVNEELQTLNNELKAKLDETARAHNDLENLMAATDIGTLFLDRDLRIKRFTPRLADIFNVKPNDEGRPIGDFTHNLEYRDFLDDTRGVLRELVPIERKVRVRNGGHVMARIRPYRTSDDKIEGLVITFVDITLIKETEDALRRSESRLQSELYVMERLHRMTMTVATADRQQDALDEILAAAIELAGADFGNIQSYDLPKQRLRIVARHGFRLSLLKRFEDVVSGRGSASERALHTGQSVRIADVMADDGYAPHREFAKQVGYRAVQSTPLFGDDGAIIGILSTHFRQPHRFNGRDEQLSELLARQAATLIHSRSQRERLSTLNDELRQRTAELEASEQKLKQQTTELLEQDRAKEEFLSLLGHELRNPLAAIRNSIDVIEMSRAMGEQRPDSRVTDSALAVVNRQSRHMTRLVNDLLDISRVNQGKLRLQPESIDIRTCINDVASALRPRCEEAHLTLEVELPGRPVYIQADPERTVQILDNLLRNAANFTDAGGQITVTVRREHGLARISVRDSGIGIEPEQIEALFEPYKQAGDGRRGGGLGLGLTVSRRLVELQGGTISANSGGPGRGSEFVIRLPLAASPPEQPTTPTRHNGSLRILIVDDDRDNADSLGALLANRGHDTTVVYDGQAALRSIHKYHPRIAFIDLTMPGMGGFELARLLREDFSAERLTLVALSGHRETVETTVFDQQLLKPASVDALEEVLASVHSIA